MFAPLIPKKQMRPRGVLTVSALIVAALGTTTSPAGAQCVDEELKQELVGGRHYRGVQERLFTKAFRHEISAMGGYYAADLYSSSWVVGGAYTFHFSEDLGLEASFAYSRFRSDVSAAYERRYPQIQLLEKIDRPAFLYFGHLVWSFGYGKVRWGGGDIMRFDFNVAAGAGVTDDTTSRGLTGSFGLGTKWYFGKWFAVRMDVRDRIHVQSIVGEEQLVNDVVVTLGASVFVPFGG